MKSRRVFGVLAFAMVAALIALPISLASISQSRTLATEGDDKAQQPPPAPDAAAEKPADAVKAPEAEPERIEGKIYKLDPETKVVGIEVPQGKAFKHYKLMLDEKSLILIGGQPSNMEGLVEGQHVAVGYFRKGKRDVIDTISVTE